MRPFFYGNARRLHVDVRTVRFGPMHGRDTPSGLLERLPLHDAGWALRYGIAAVGLALAFAIRWLVQPYVGTSIPFATFLLSTILVTFVAGRGPGIFSSIGGALLAIWFFIPPLYSFEMSRTAMVTTFTFLTLDLVLITCIHMAQMAKRRSDQLAETSRLMFDELQHRVSNNLQVIGSLLSAQKRRVTDESARQAIDEAANRLSVVGRISRELYRPDGGLSDMASFLGRLSDAVLEASGRDDVRCTLHIPADIMLAPDRAVPLALVFTEALSNALEHGLPDRVGEVSVTLSPSAPEGRFILSVEDDGKGLSDRFDLEQTQSLGLQIARQLARQLGGEFALTAGASGKGTRATLSIAAA